LLPLLDAAHARRPRPAIACSVRDILVGKSDPRRLRETVDIVKRYFDRILVHGDPRLVEFGATFAAADEIAERIGYTGYVVIPPAQTTDSLAGQGEVLVSAGGGAVGAPLLRAALAARPLTTLASAPWRVLTGHNLSEADFGALRATADSGITVERFRPDFQARLHSCRLSVSQAGYNTVMEILSAGARAVVVPFAEGGESEQPLRAELLSRRGLLTVVHPDRLNAASLAAAINHAAGRPAPHPSGIDMAGAENTAKAVADLLSATPHAAN
jgi:predicted glycosyltransferase